VAEAVAETVAEAVAEAAAETVAEAVAEAVAETVAETVAEACRTIALSQSINNYIYIIVSVYIISRFLDIYCIRGLI